MPLKAIGNVLIKTGMPLWLLFFWNCPGYAREGIEWDRFRFRPKLSIVEIYTDNVFRTSADEKKEHITGISADMAVDFALAPRNILTLSYAGDYRIYHKYDNFRNDHHLGSLSWNWTLPKGSNVELGVNVLDSAIQPFSENGRSKDFTKWETFAGGALQLMNFTELGLRYKYTSRRFAEAGDEQGDFDRNGVSLSMLYRRLPRLPLLLEYNYATQDNNDPTGPSTDSITQTVFGGLRWGPAEKLSGHLKIGHVFTDFKEVEDFNGFAADIDLFYQLSEFTRFKLEAYRSPVRSTRAARETGNYYILTGGSLTATYHRWESLALKVEFTYWNREFRQSRGTDRDREDNFYKAGIATTYFFKEKIWVSLGYQHRVNDSNFEPVDYRENIFDLKFSISK